MTEKIIIAGSGGQGVLTLGVFIARVGFYEGKKVAWLPTYGAEKRGGFSFCYTVISDDEIFSPVVETPSTLFAFDQRAYDTYKIKIGKETQVIINSSLIKDFDRNNKNIFKVPATELAKDIGFIQGMNIVMFGVYFELKKIFKKESIYEVMKEMLKGKKEEIFSKNKMAFEKGIGYSNNK